MSKIRPNQIHILCPSLSIGGQLPAPIVNGGGDSFENGRISNFQGLVTLTLTLDQVTLHTVVHHSSTSTYIPNCIEIEETFCGQMDVRTLGTGFIQNMLEFSSKQHYWLQGTTNPIFTIITLHNIWNQNNDLIVTNKIWSYLSRPQMALSRSWKLPAEACARTKNVTGTVYHAQWHQAWLKDTYMSTRNHLTRSFHVPLY